MTFTDWEEGCSEMCLAQRVLRERTCQEVGSTGLVPNVPVSIALHA